MELLTMLDVALGLVFIYLLFALIATATNEAIAALLSSRAKWLKRGIESLFQGETLESIEQSVEKILNHPATAHYSRRPGKRPGMGKLQREWQTSYLPSDALLHAIVSSPEDAAYPNSVAQLRERISLLPEKTPIRVALERLLNADVEQTIEQFAERFDEWYQTFQQQISNWYRQKTHFMLWIISLVIALIFNLDSILMMRALSMDDALRANLASQANQVAESEEPPRSSVVLSPAGQMQPTALSSDDPATPLKNEVAELKRHVLALQTAGLPIGWTGTPTDWGAAPSSGTADSPSLADWLFKVLGIFLTAAAMTLGAPFWFDLLKKISSVRSTGAGLLKKPETPSTG